MSAKSYQHSVSKQVCESASWSSLPNLCIAEAVTLGWSFIKAGFKSPHCWNKPFLYEITGPYSGDPIRVGVGNVRIAILCRKSTL